MAENEIRLGPISPLGERYLHGELTQHQLQGAFEVSHREQIPILAELPVDARERLIARGRAALGGRVAHCVLAAGASSRMNLAQLPDRVRELIAIGGRTALPQSKALVPAVEYAGQVATYLDLFLVNVREFLREHEAENPTLLFLSERNQQEIGEYLQRREYLGLAAERVLSFTQSLEPQIVATAEDVARARKNFPDEAAYLAAREFSQRHAGHDLPVGKPAGHGEFLHQLVSSGMLGTLANQGVEYLSVRNIDNAAAVVNDDWLAIYGYAVEEQLDFVVEVAQRLPGQKGGALIRRGGSWQLAEDPSFAGSGKSAADSYYINNAVAIIKLDYLYDLYDTGREELAAADPGRRAELAAAGRAKFPTIVEAKPVVIGGQMVAAITPETNLWESTGVARRSRIGAVAVPSERDLGDDYFQLAPQAQASRALRVRFSPTKNWDDYANPVKQAILKQLAARILA